MCPVSLGLRFASDVVPQNKKHGRCYFPRPFAARQTWRFYSGEVPVYAFFTSHRQIELENRRFLRGPRSGPMFPPPQYKKKPTQKKTTKIVLQLSSSKQLKGSFLMC